MPKKTYHVDPARLLQLRHRDNKTQEEVGAYLRKSRGKPSKLERLDQRHSDTNTYQKLEKSGKTSEKSAQALANFYNVSMRALQGLEPVDTITRIAALLKSQLAEGSNEQLQKENANFDAGCQGYSPEEKLRKLAEQIGERLEAVQWSRNPAELNRLAILTGLSEAALLTPAYVRGYWWVTGSQPGALDARVVSGLVNLIDLVRKAWKDSPPPRSTGGQTTIRLSRTGLRYRLDAEGYRHHRPWWFEFIGCEPDGDKGVRWSAALQWDQEFLETQLRNFAFENAHVVYDFGGNRIPGDSKRLCFVVTLMSLKEDSGWQTSGQTVFRGDLHEVDDNLLRMWDQHDQREIFFLSWLTSDLKRSLHPHLKTHEPEYWKVSTEDWEFVQDAWALSPEASIEVTLCRPDKITHHSQGLLPAMKYEIKLMLEVSAGEFVRAPWESSEVKRLRDEIRTWIEEPLPEDGYVGVTQSFEPPPVMK